jgi:TonB family protein
VRINPGDNGVFKFGELSLFFQFTEPAVATTPSSLRNFDRGMAASALLSAAIQISFLLAIVVSPRPVSVKVKSKEELRRFIKIDVKRDEKKKERQKKEEQVKKEEEEKPEIEKLPEEETLKEEIEDTPTVEQKLQDAGDPLKKAVDVPKKDEDFKPMKEGHVGRDAKRDSKLSKEMKKKGVIAVLDSKMKKNTSLSKLLGKDRNLAVKNVVWGEDGNYQLANEGDSDFSYMGSSGGTGDYGGGGGFGGAGGFGGGGGGFGGGGAFGLGGMGGAGGGLPGGIGGADANRSGRQALASLKGRDRKRASKVKLGSGSMGQFCKKNDVQRKVQGRSAAIRACYEMQLQMKPDLAGKITVQFIIDLTGRVKGVKAVQNSTGNAKLDQCISRIIGKIHFQPPAGGMCIIRWPFVFSPGA